MRNRARNGGLEKRQVEHSDRGVAVYIYNAGRKRAPPKKNNK